MSGKGIAISQIILLVLGIIVLAVVAFLLYSNFVSTGGAIDAQKCRSEATNACTSCSIASGGQISNCVASTYLVSSFAKGCAISGNIAIAGNNFVRATDGTYSGGDGTITCTQYVGGAAAPIEGSACGPSTKTCIIQNGKCIDSATKAAC